MPGFTVTRGFGPGASPSAFILQGFGPAALVEVVRIIRGGRSAAKRTIRDWEESFKISAMLLRANGKDLMKPIINKVSKTFLESKILKVVVKPKKVITRKADDIKVEVVNFGVRKNNDDD